MNQSFSDQLVPLTSIHRVGPSYFHMISHLDSLPLPHVLIVSLFHLVFPSPPGPPGFLLPDRTALHCWGLETGRLETGLEKADWIQRLSRNRDENGCINLLLHCRKTYLNYTVREREGVCVCVFLCFHSYEDPAEDALFYKTLIWILGPVQKSS